MARKRILVLYYVPRNSLKYHHWHDGFTAALERLSMRYDVSMVNIDDCESVQFDEYGMIIVKSGFDWKVDKWIRRLYPESAKRVPVSICVSSIAKPTQQHLEYYDVIFYETEWYRFYAELDRHPQVLHAFGVDVDLMRPRGCQKRYDVLFVGAIRDYKRPLELLKMKGRRIAVGEHTEPGIVQQLKEAGVELRPFVSYADLAALYNMSRRCLVPCTLKGGGERAVLESRACGIEVTVLSDNPKLKELVASPLFDAGYYAQQLAAGIEICSASCKPRLAGNDRNCNAHGN